MRAIPEKYLPKEPEPSRIEQMQARLKERKQEPPEKENPLDAILQTVITMSAQQQASLEQIGEYGKVVARCVEEIAKPKPRKKWGCAVSRNASGQINNVDIEEK